MDPKAHKRFLEYLERYEYFRQPGLEKLAGEVWLRLDAALVELQRDEAGSSNAARIKALRRVLLRD
ncbi:MAG: hypothetical protein IT378_19795 [Sandaracinaceae bacterium]|nr:hypothetical protein [Sandaracinaceae bacterium]